MKKAHWGTAVRFALLLVISLIWAIPLIWCVWSAIRPASMVTKFNFELTFSAENFRYVFELWDFFTYLKNSLIITLGTLAVQLFTVTLAAYAIARLEFAGKKLVMTILMAHMVIPGSVLLLSNYLTIKEMGLLDRRLGVMVIYLGSSMGIMLLRQCYKTIPKALEEAAVIDGCNLAQSLLHVYLPSCKTAYLSFAIVSINFHWNNYLWPNVVINNSSRQTLPVGLALLTKISGDAGPQWAYACAATLVVLAPLMVLFLLFQKQFINSFISSGIK
ncbi:MAG TPA: carbohydrate ABC transporter permease [Candidatus Faecivicinus avistercoris]|nr:carbohydrate ABC transporter permease [Candidatus Faecivicinus avistercoris]